MTTHRTAGQAPVVGVRPKDQAVARTVELALRVNGVERRLEIEPRVTLLDALRERIGLTGTKKGCDQGQCEGREVTTIEGLAGADGALHPVQAAFVQHDAFQCGYCTPGQIMSAVACIQEGHAGSDADIREYMSGNLCRCGAYPNIVAAVRAAAEHMEQGRAHG
jgi:xanthine dehydrogenase YagT iron-sulfur-binding subunit